MSDVISSFYWLPYAAAVLLSLSAFYWIKRQFDRWANKVADRRLGLMHVAAARQAIVQDSPVARGQAVTHTRHLRAIMDEYGFAEEDFGLTRDELVRLENGRPPIGQSYLGRPPVPVAEPHDRTRASRQMPAVSQAPHVPGDIVTLAESAQRRQSRR
jgi:hypothetical protein